MSSKYRQLTAVSLGLMFVIASSGTAHADSPAALSKAELSKAEALRGTAPAGLARPFDAAPARSVRKPRKHPSIRRGSKGIAIAATSARPATGYVGPGSWYVWNNRWVIDYFWINPISSGLGVGFDYQTQSHVYYERWYLARDGRIYFWFAGSFVRPN